MDRRTLLRAGIAAAIASSVRIPALAATQADGDLARLLQQLAESHLRNSPREATQFEFDVGVNSGLRSQLDDVSLSAIARHRNAAAVAVEQLTRIDRNKLSAASKLDYHTAKFVFTTLKGPLSRFGTLDLDLRPSPYPVSQMNGAYYWLPEFLGSNHPLASTQDVEAYFARLNALAVVVDQETERIRHDAALGVVPPSFVLAKTIAQIEALRNTAPLQTESQGLRWCLGAARWCCLLRRGVEIEHDDVSRRGRATSQGLAARGQYHGATGSGLARARTEERRRR